MNKSTTLPAPVKGATRKPPQRFLQWLCRAPHGGGILQIRLVYSPTHAETDAYSVTRLRDGEGRFSLVRLGESTATYTVEAPRGGGAGFCTCPAGQHARACKHLGAIVALMRRGDL